MNTNAANARAAAGAQTAPSPDLIAEATAQTRWLAATAALLLAVPLLWGAGFASADALHDTAHDVRHAMGLPCH